MLIPVCHISTVHSSYDDRIYYKEVKSLADQGFKVFLIIRNDKNEVRNKVQIQRVPEQMGILRRFFFDLIVAPIKVLRTRAQVVHFHDPELIFTGLILKLFRKKVIYDIHELVYYQIGDRRLYNLNSVIQKIYLLFEFLALKYFDLIILAEEGYLSYYLRKYQGQSDKIKVISNFPVVQLINSVKPLPNTSKKLVLIYVGGLSRVRGIKELIESTENLKDQVELWLLGEWEDNNYFVECQSLTGWKNIKYFGFVRLEEVYKYMKAADIGVALLYPIPNHLTSLAVKIFEYMACGIPMLLSDFPLWEEKFSECSVFADPYNPKAISEAIHSLCTDKDMRIRLGNGGKKLVNEHYSWESESKKLINMYNSII